jgi:hypothetical protein
MGSCLFDGEGINSLSPNPLQASQPFFNYSHLLEPQFDHLYIARTEVLRRLGLALAIGLLIGVERGWQERSAIEGERVAGIREEDPTPASDLTLCMLEKFSLQFSHFQESGES